MVYILLGTGFEEAEALATADVLRRAELPVSLTGIGGEYVTGSHGITVRADIKVEDVALANGDTVVLPGGLGGVASMEGSEAAMALIREAAHEDDRLRLAAICAAPTLLARAGLLKKDARCVCYPGLEGELSAAGAKLYIGLGGAMDVFAGKVERAPERMQKLGLEWLYRLVKQPSRIGRMAKLPLFLVSAVGARVRGK